MTLLALAPYAVGRGRADGLAPILGAGREAASPSKVGSGSDLSIVADGSDDYYYVVSGGTQDSYYPDGTSAHVVNPVWADFTLPADAGDPSAIAIRVRAATPGFSLGNDPGSYRDWQTFFTDTSWGYLGTLGGGDTNLTALEMLSQSGFADFDYWYGIVDPADHTDNGDWFEFAANGSTGANVKIALTGAGLRITVFMDSWNTVDPNFHWAWLSELRLLVETDGPVAPTYIRKSSIRQLQRGGAGGLGGIPRGRGVATARGSLRRGPDAIY